MNRHYRINKARNVSYYPPKGHVWWEVWIEGTPSQPRRNQRAAWHYARRLHQQGVAVRIWRIKRGESKRWVWPPDAPLPTWKLWRSKASDGNGQLCAKGSGF